METPMCNHALFVSVHYYGEFSLWRPGGSNLDCNLVVSRIRKYTNKCDDDPTTIPMTDLFCSTSNQPSKWRTRATWTAITREEPWDRMIFRVQPLAQSHFHHFHQTLLQPDRSDRNDRFQRQFVGNLRPQTEYPHQMPVQKLASISEFLLIRTLWEQSISQKHGPTSIIFNIFCSLLRSSNDHQWSNLIQSDPISSNLIQSDPMDDDVIGTPALRWRSPRRKVKMGQICRAAKTWISGRSTRPGQRWQNYRNHHFDIGKINFKWGIFNS